MNYSSLLTSRNSAKWKKVGIDRRAGVVVPLFSVYSKNSIGIGEIPDLRIVINWCKQTGLSILQLLPLNETGDDFAPYNAISTFALDPMYLSILKLRKVDLKPFRKELILLRKNFPKGTGSINYEIKQEKLKLLRKIFDSHETENIPQFKTFVEKNIHWLKYYSLFKVLFRQNDNKAWNEWDFKYKYISSIIAEKIYRAHTSEINFNYWLQWQLYEQMISVRNYAKRMGVFIMGDLPFLVARNSADVWAYKNYFKTDLSSGAPPDMYFSKGQKWGMPPYNWANIETDDYNYIRQRLKYAENFFDMFRIDHFVGLFRVWSIDLKIPEEYAGLIGKFDPEDENLWEEHGSTILDVMSRSTTMLPCAEDLGTVPKCSDIVLKEFGVTGINVQRWEKTLNGQPEFISPNKYRMNSVATISTHDSSPFPVWFTYECGTIDEFSFSRVCDKLNIKNEKYEELVNLFFDTTYRDYGRLLWKKEISNVYMLLEILKMNYDQAREITEMYLGSYGEKNIFLKYLGKKNDRLDPAVIRKNLEMINSSDSIFSIQMIMEYLYLDKSILENFSKPNDRINFPGTVSGLNWSMTIPIGLEELNGMKINEVIGGINKKTKRFI